MKKIILASMLISTLGASEKTTSIVVSIQGAFANSIFTSSNTRGKAKTDYHLDTVKLIVGSDVDLYGVGETSRFFGAYKYTNDFGGAMHTYSGGYLENMTYLSFYDKNDRKMFPFASYEIGYVDTEYGDGYNSEINLGVAYSFENIEFSLAYAYNYSYLGETAGNTAQYLHSNQAVFGLTYKFMNEGK